jgi:hypothetical protein
MENSFVKFIYADTKDNDIRNKHWEYCCANKIPCIVVIKSGTKYWKIDFEVFSVTKMERFVIINYAEHIMPLYELYIKYTNLPSSKISAAGGGRNLVFTVYKKDAPEIAEKLFDLLFHLSKRDQVLFDENPYTIDKEGRNSEGWHVAKFVEELKEMSDLEIIKEYRRIKTGNPLMLQTLELIINEMIKRNISSDNFMEKITSK